MSDTRRVAPIVLSGERLSAEGQHMGLLALCLGLCGCSAVAPAPAPAPDPASALLYNVDFSAPEQAVGAVVKFTDPDAEQTYPSTIPSGAVGQPIVIGRLCGLEQQPVQLTVQAIRAMEGLEFEFDRRYGRYHVELDLCVERLDPPPLPAEALQVVVFLDIPEAHALGFVSGGDLVIVDPTLHPETITNPKPVGRFRLGKPVHVALDVDLEKQTWRVAVDGKPVYSDAVIASNPLSVRVLARGNPTTAAALDNVLIWGEHDLTPISTLPEPPAAGPGTE